MLHKYVLHDSKENFAIVGYGDATHSFRANINNLLRYLNVRNI